ncbi:hypothetical protein [Bartonella elizabethae]|nr:hypothetical protein [Bartonella elizabethae]
MNRLECQEIFVTLGGKVCNGSKFLLHKRKNMRLNGTLPKPFMGVVVKGLE